MDDYQYEQTSSPSTPLTWQGVGAVLVAGLSNIADGVSDTLEGLSTLLAADHNYRIDRRTMHEQGALEIETLIRGD